MRTQGTLDGKTLTPEQRKAGFKAAKGGADSVGWKQFLDSVEQTKTTSDEGITPNTKMLPGSGDMGQGVLEGIATDVKSILGVIDSRTEAEEDAADEIKQEKEKDTRKDKEEKKEEKANKKGPLPSFIKKATAPVENILGAIVKTFSLLLAGWGITKLLDWLGNPKNAKAVEELKDFITVALPPILKGILALVALDIGLKVFAFAKMLAAGSLKLFMGLKQMAIGVAKWAMANPRLAIAMGLGAAAIGLFLNSGGSGDDTEQGTSDNNIDTEVELNGGGLVPIQKFKEGGFVSGPSGVDKVPAKLTAGEFVMSKGAVQKYGASTLANMNAAGGGTNRPTFSKGTSGFNEGGQAIDKSHYGTVGYRMGQVRPDMYVYSKENFISNYTTKGGEVIEDSQDYTEISGSIAVEDLMAHQKQLMGKINSIGGYENANIMDVMERMNGRGELVGMPDEILYPILNSSDAWKATDRKRDEGIAMDSEAGTSFLDPKEGQKILMNGGGLVPIQNFQGGGGVKAIKTATQLMNSVPGDSGSSGSSGATILPVPSGSGSGNAGNSGSVDNLVMFSPVDGDNLSSLIMKSMYSILD